MSRSTNSALPTLRVTLLGSSTPGKTKLSRQLRSRNPNIKVFTQESSAGQAGNEGLTFLLGLGSSHANDVATDRLLRSDLDRHHISYQVLYGTGEECLGMALQVIQSKLGMRPASAGSTQKLPADQSSEQNSKWIWECDKCSDPACEHRLLTGLLANRGIRATEPLP